MEINKVYNEDCLLTLQRMPDAFLDLTVTSPPYDNLRKYNGYSWDFHSIAKELYRATKGGGVVVWVVADATVKGSETGTSFRQALWFMECGFRLHDTMIWHKANPMPTQKTRYEQAFEYMFVLSKFAPKTTNMLKEPCKRHGLPTRKHHTIPGNKDAPVHGHYLTKASKIRHNVVPYAVGTHKGIPHAAPFPESLARDHILSWSNPGDLIYDPFLGSGTTAKMAIQTGRNWIGSEISAEYCELIASRLSP